MAGSQRPRPAPPGAALCPSLWALPTETSLLQPGVVSMLSPSAWDSPRPGDVKETRAQGGRGVPRVAVLMAAVSEAVSMGATGWTSPDCHLWYVTGGH